MAAYTFRRGRSSQPPQSGISARTPLQSSHRVRPLPGADSFPNLYEEFFPLVWRTARRMGVGDAALDDVCQEIFLSIYKQLPAYQGQSALRTWIFGFIVNHVLVYHRGQRRKNPQHRAVGALIDPDMLADEVSLPLEQRQRVREAAEIAHHVLSQMPTMKRLIFVMAELEGLTGTEIARALELNLNTVYARLRSARRQFKRLTRRHLAADEPE